MNIVLASDSYFPVISGVTTVVYKQAVELAKRKHQVSIVCMGTKTKLIRRKKDNVLILRLPSIINPVRTDHRIPIPLPNKLKEAMALVKPDVIHIHTPGTIGLWALRFARKHNILSVASCHGTPDFITSYFDFLPSSVNQSTEKALWQYYRWFLNKVDFVLAPSGYIKKQLKKNKVKTKTVVLPMWIDIPKKRHFSKKHLREKWHIPEAKIVFLYFGRLDKDKNLRALIKAMQILNNKLKDKASLLMGGKGCQEKELKKFVVKKNLTNFVKFTGYIKDKSLKEDEIYELANVFIIPSLFETQSIVTLQAISYGLPVIVANSGALTEIAKRFPKYCSTFNPKNIASLVKKMKDFIINPPKTKYKPPKKFQLIYDKNAILNSLEIIYQQAKKTTASSRG